MLTLIMGIACMIVGYVLGSIDTDKKWVIKTKEVEAGDTSCKDLFMRVKYSDGSEEVMRVPEKDTLTAIGKENA